MANDAPKPKAPVLMAPRPQAPRPQAPKPVAPRPVAPRPVSKSSPNYSSGSAVHGAEAIETAPARKSMPTIQVDPEWLIEASPESVKPVSNRPAPRTSLATIMVEDVWLEEEPTTIRSAPKQ